jgi:DNA-binding LytR/AlgR family response regulator
MLATAEIDWIEARGDYARIHRGARSDLVRESLSGLEARLGPRVSSASTARRS